MEKSIETIWKEGFMQEDSVVIPRVNDLYNRKSMDIVDTLRRMFRINLTAVTVAVVAIPIMAAIIEFGVARLASPSGPQPFVFFPGLALSVLLAILVGIGRQELARLETFDKGETSYQYLKTFAEWRRASVRRYGRFYQAFYPLFLLIIATGIWFSMGDSLASKVSQEFRDNALAQQIPALWMVGTVIGMGVAALLAKPLYRLDMNLVYGRQFKKLDEIIADMEELRA
jgi:hypothetical protein